MRRMIGDRICFMLVLVLVLVTVPVEAYAVEPMDTVIETGSEAVISGSGAEVSADNTIPEDDTAGNEGDADLLSEPAGQDVVTVSGNEAVFEILTPMIMYGEDGSNANGNLDRLFKPVYTVNDREWVLVSADSLEAEDGAGNAVYSVEYKFFTDIAYADTVNAGNFDELEGVRLEEISAGTDFVAAVKASGRDDEGVVAARILTMHKRPLTVAVERSRDIGVSEKDMPEDEKVTVSANTPAFDNVVITPVENNENQAGESSFVYAYDEALMPENAIEGDVWLDVSGIDGDRVGYQEVPVIAALNDDLNDNYEILESPTADGYVYVEESTYYITFAVKVNGQTYTKQYINDISETNTVFSTWINESGRKAAVTNPNTYDLDYSVIGAVTGWGMYQDGKYEREYDTDMRYVVGTTTYTSYVNRKTDYYFIARTSRKAINNIYVEAIPGVEYDGRAHVVTDQPLKKTDSTINDIKLSVFCSLDGGAYDVYKLRYGKDYKVSYKNNTNASVLMGSDGIYKDRDLPAAQRPQVIITGLGDYTGYTTTVYFDITPYNLAKAPEYATASVSGLKHLYALKGGRLSGKAAPSVTIRFPFDGKAKKLKAGVDYVPAIYKYEGNKWVLKNETGGDVNAITGEGKYLYTLKGIGNYCGVYFGSEKYRDDFDPAGARWGVVKPAVCSYNDSNYSPCQFMVKDDTIYDLSNAAVNVKTTGVNYTGKYYTPTDLGIEVYIGSGKNKIKLNEGEDYRVLFDGVDYIYYEGIYTNGVYKTAIYEAKYYNKIGISNKYKVIIEAISGNARGVFGSREAGKQVTIKGITIAPKWYKLAASNAVYNGAWEDGGSYKYSTAKRVTDVNPDSCLYNVKSSETYTDSYGKYYKYTYVGTDEEMKLISNGVVVSGDYAKLPGTYLNNVYPFGPGVDHSSPIKVKFTKKAVNMKDALKDVEVKVGDNTYKYRLLELTAAPGKQNAAGAMPGSVTVKYTTVKHDGTKATKEQNLKMYYNGQEFKIEDAEGYTTTIRLYASNNTKPGQGTLSIEGDGEIFKGKAAACTYAINKIEVPAEIPVLDRDSYIHKYGSYTSTVGTRESENPAGTVYAVMGTEKKGKTAPGNPKITLYQSYYANGSELEDKRAGLKKIDSKCYKLVLTSNGDYGYKVRVTNSGSAELTGYDFNKNSSSLKEDYTVYDTGAAITDLEVSYYGKTYYLGRKGESLSIPYTGKQITADGSAFQILSVGIKGTDERLYTAVHPFRVEYGNNVAAGKNKGTITIILQRDDTGKYKLGGSQTFKFNIMAADHKTL